METIQGSKITFARPTTAGELLGVKSPDKQLDLTSVPLHIARIDSADEVSKYLAVFDSPLLGASFHRLLTLTAPRPAFANNYKGILDDWSLYDNPKEIERQKRHDELKEHIEAFKKYRPRLIKNLGSQGRGTLWSSNRPVARETLIGHNIRALEEEVQINLGLINEVYPPNFTRIFAQHLRGERYKKLGYDIPGGDDHFVVAMFGMRGGSGDIVKNHEVWWDFLQTLTPTQKEAFALEVEGFEFLGWHPGTKKYIGLGIVEPTVVWESTPDAVRGIKRDVDCFPLPKNTSLQLNQQLKAYGSDLTGFFHYNPMAGLLAIKYLLPEIGEHWKQRLPLPKSKEHESNVMAEQAVLVLASMMRGSILASRFFPQAEDFFHKNPTPKEAGS